MSAEDALIAALQADPGVSDLVGSRVFIAGGRQGTPYPYITVQRITTSGAASIDRPATLEWPLFQLDAWGETAASAKDAGEAAIAAIDGKEITAGGLTITATKQDQRGPAPDEETRKYRVSQDYYIWHERA